MHSSFVVATFALLATLAAGQASTTVSQSMPPTATAGFNSAPIPRELRFQWCLGQRNNCPRICGGTTQENECTEETLVYSCICSNGTVPDVSAYRDTLPFYICEQTYVQCVAQNPNDAEGQDTCKNNKQCGTLNATAIEEESSDSSETPSRTATASETSATSAPESSTSASPTNAAVALSQRVATPAFAAILLAAFRFLL